MKPVRIVTWTLALSLAPLCAVAQPRPIDPVEEHLRLGVELRRSGHNDEALVEFEAAYGLRRDPRTAAQFGLATQAVGRWLRADALLREGIAAPNDPWITRNRAALDGALAVVGRHLATLDLVGDVAGARVRINGDEVGALPLTAPVRVLAGTVTVDVTAEGYEPLTLRFVASAGENLRERVVLVATRPVTPAVVTPPQPVAPVATPVVAAPTPVTPPASPAVVPGARPPWTPLAIGAFAGAGVLLVGGTVALILQQGAASDYNAQCDAGDARGTCGELRDRAVATQTLGWTTLPLGALLAAAGTYFVLRDRATPTHATTRNGCGVGVSSVQCAFAF
jgi:PEGA domain